MSGSVGFLGLGIMGRPMALRLARAGVPLVVWNRSPGAADALVAAGASARASIDEVFAECETVILMLRDERAVDAVLHGGDRGRLARLVAGRTVVNMGTVAPAFSRALAEEIEAAGGAYAEAPVSGSRQPAEAGELVAMLAGRALTVERVAPLLEPMCARVMRCGEVPAGLTTKLAVNVFLIAVVTGLAESFHFALEHGVDPALLREILDSGQTASPISRVKTAKLVADDLSPQAAIADVLMNAELILAAAREASIATPLLDVARDLYAAASARGDGALDMIGVIRAIAERGRAEDRRGSAA